MVKNNKPNAMVEIITSALLFSNITETKFRVSDKEVSIRKTFPTISDEKAMALTALSECPSLMDKK